MKVTRTWAPMSKQELREAQAAPSLRSVRHVVESPRTPAELEERRREAERQTPA